MHLYVAVILLREVSFANDPFQAALLPTQSSHFIQPWKIPIRWKTRMCLIRVSGEVYFHNKFSEPKLPNLDEIAICLLFHQQTKMTDITFLPTQKRCSVLSMMHVKVNNTLDTQNYIGAPHPAHPSECTANTLFNLNLYSTQTAQ